MTHWGYAKRIFTHILLLFLIVFLPLVLQFGKQAVITPECWKGFVATPGIVIGEKWSCLHGAAANGDVRLLRTLLDAGAAVDDRNGLGRSPLYEAAKRGHVNAAQFLLERGADPNFHGRKLSLTPVHVASEYNNPEVLELLLAAGGDANVRAYSGTTPLRQASWKAQDDIRVYEVLLRHGADPAIGTTKGWTPLHHGAKLGHAKRVALLVTHGAPLNAMTASNRTPLHLAVREHHQEVVRILLEAGADTEAGDPEWTPLRLAVYYEDDNMARLLQEHGAVGSPEFFDLLQVAAAAWERDDYQEYLRITSDALRITDRFPPVYRWRALAFGMLLRFEEAHGELDAFLALKPDTREGQAARLYLHMKEGNHVAARELIAEILTRWPDMGYAYMARGYLKLRLEHDMSGLDDLEEACSHDEEHACEMLAHARRHRAGDWLEGLKWETPK